jgi:signal transduction histidine kinase
VVEDEPGDGAVSQDQALARAGWLSVADRIMAGIAHDLNGRVTSLAGMAQLLALDDDARGMAPFLDEEIRKLQASVRLVALMVGELEGEPETLEPGEFLPAVLDLHRRHRGLESVELRLDEEDAPAVTTGWTLLARTLLLVLAIAGSAAAERGRVLRVRASGGAKGGLLLDLLAPGERDHDAPRSAPYAWRPDLELVAGVVTLLPATLEAQEGPDAFRLSVSFPTATRVRSIRDGGRLGS